MPGKESRSTGLIAIGLPALIVAVGVLMHQLPLKVAFLLMAWSVFSLPVGIAIGHCALSEDR